MKLEQILHVKIPTILKKEDKENNQTWPRYWKWLFFFIALGAHLYMEKAIQYLSIACYVHCSLKSNQQKVQTLRGQNWNSQY